MAEWKCGGLLIRSPSSHGVGSIPTASARAPLSKEAARKHAVLIRARKRAALLRPKDVEK